MRDVFVRKITKMILADERVCLLTGDMGNNLFNQIVINRPKQFINCGISEAAMIGVAAGLASKGYIPFIYSIAPFVTLRVLEQIKIDLCYNELPATIIGLGAGLSYGALGPTHHSLEDIAILRAIPNLDIYLPSCADQLINFMGKRTSSSKPAYIRLDRNEGKKTEPYLVQTDIGKATLIEGGKDALIIAAGAMMNEALQAKISLKSFGVNCSIVDLGTIRPIDSKMLRKLANDTYKYWYVLEEHGPSGICSIIIEELVIKQGITNLPQIRSLNTGNAFIHELGNREFLLNCLKINSRSLSNLIHSDIASKKNGI